MSDGGDASDGDVAEAGAGDVHDPRADDVAEAAGVTARYYETESERVLALERAAGSGTARSAGEDAATGSEATRSAAVAQNREGYAMLKVRTAPDGDELERYYGFEMALDHAAELLGVHPSDLPVPDAAADMGM